MKKILAIALALMLCITPVSAQEEKIQMITPNSPFYPIDLLLENIWEKLSLSAEAKLVKQVIHAQERIAEMKWCVDNNREDLILKVTEKYEQKTERIRTTNREKIEIRLLDETEKELGRQNEVLQSLLASPTMPEQSQQGLERAVTATSRVRETVIQETAVRVDEDKTLLTRYENTFLNVPIKLEFPTSYTQTTTITFTVTDDSEVVHLGDYQATYDPETREILITNVVHTSEAGGGGGTLTHQVIALTLSDINDLSEYADDSVITWSEAGMILPKFSGLLGRT